ncbi:hypothetical protein [Streptomyces sp. NBC_00648]|uniref:hypothetical protein n=1 Tax=Streptomyces sp. NBC_00648 TaxID=2975797 RepID=UPI00324946A7
MDTDLRKLAGHLRDHGLHVTFSGAGHTLQTANPLHEALTEEIATADGQYVTSFGHEIGEGGRERACAERIAHILAIPATDGTADPAAAAPHDPAQYRRCEVCHEMGADVITRMFVADTGGDHTSYAHSSCAGVITP